MKRRREGGRLVQESPRFRRVTQRTVGESGPDPIDADADGQATAIVGKVEDRPERVSRPVERTPSAFPTSTLTRP